MKRSSAIVFSVLATQSAWADWEFADKKEVATYSGSNKVFHHMDGPGRKNIAISTDAVAVIWEDNRSGAPHIYMASKHVNTSEFGKPIKVSDGVEAYEPTIVSANDSGFVMAWEQDGNIWVKTFSNNKSGKAVRLSEKNGRQVSLLRAEKNKYYAAWSMNTNGGSLISVKSLTLNNGQILPGKEQLVDSHQGKHYQFYPVLGKAGNNIGVVWEDRRGGHTKLLYSKLQRNGKFAKPSELNEVVKKSEKYGSGSGVARVALSNYGENELAAVWMDKRNRSTGYDIFAAVNKQSDFIFGKNAQVQDSFGDNIAQWNPAIAGNSQGDIAILWYDAREETMDILVSYKTDSGWTEDFLVTPASGTGDQTNASAVFDDKRNLHIVWISQENAKSGTKLFYSIGRPQ